MLDQKASRRRLLVAAVGALLATLALNGCDVEADLAAYFGTAQPTASSTSGSPSPSPAVSDSPTPPPSIPPTTSPPPSPTASVSASPGSTASGSPLPTRPPGLAEFPTLRERARIIDYDRLLARPADFEGEFVYFEGHVLGLSDDDPDHVTVRVRSGGKVMHWTYDAASYWGQPLVQGDRVRVVGDFVGLENDAQADTRVPVIESLEIIIKFT